MPAFVGFCFPPLPLGVSFASGTDGLNWYADMSVPAPNGGKQKCYFFKLLSVSSRLHDKVFSLC